MIGLLELESGSPDGAIQTMALFDRIEMHVDYPLVDDPDTDISSSIRFRNK